MKFVVVLFCPLAYAAIPFGGIVQTFNYLILSISSAAALEIPIMGKWLAT